MGKVKDNPLVPQVETAYVDGEYIGRDYSNEIFYDEWIESPVTEIISGCVDSESCIVIHGDLGNKVSFTKDQVKILLPQLFKFIHTVAKK